MGMISIIPRSRICGETMRIQNGDGQFICRACTLEQIMDYFTKGEDDDCNRYSERDKTTED